MGVIGTAKNKFRTDNGRRWKAAKVVDKTNADSARERMIERENKNSLTDEIFDALGGNNAARMQAESMQSYMQSVKEGKKTGHTPESAAEAARNRMIERQERKKPKEDDEENPDIGKDRANRKAYPAKKVK